MAGIAAMSRGKPRDDVILLCFVAPLLLPFLALVFFISHAHTTNPQLVAGVETPHPSASSLSSEEKTVPPGSVSDRPNDIGDGAAHPPEEEVSSTSSKSASASSSRQSLLSSLSVTSTFPTESEGEDPSLSAADGIRKTRTSPEAPLPLSRDLVRRLIYAVVIDAGSTGSRVAVYQVFYQEGQCHGGLGKATVRMPAVAVRRVGPGIALYAKRAQGRKSRPHEGPIEGEGKEAKAATLPGQTAHSKRSSPRSPTAQQVVEEFTEGAQTKNSATVGSGEEPKVSRQSSSLAPEKKTERFGREDDVEGGLEEYLEKLKEFVYSAIPDENERKDAFLFFRGTAGMRALSPGQRERLLHQVRKGLETWGFRLPDGPIGVGVLDGEEEGVLGWVALNQVLGLFDEANRLVEIDTQKGQAASSSNEGRAGNSKEESLGSRADLASPVEEEGKQTGKEEQKRKAGLIEMGGASAQVVVQLPADLLPSADVDTPRVFTKEGPGERDPGSASSLPLTKPIRPHTRGGIGLPDGDTSGLVEVDLCTERHVVYSRSYQGLGRQHAMMQHIHNSVIHDLERRREDIRQGRQRPPTREDPFEASVPCLPADIRVKVEASRLAQATFDEDLQQSLQEEEDDLEQSAEEEKEQDEKAEPREEGSPSRRAHENEGKGKVSQKKRRKSRTSPHQHLPGVPRRGVPSDEMMWLMMGDNGAGLLDQIELVVAQGSSHGLHCLQHVGKLMSEVPELPFQIHPDVPLYATENFYHFNEYVLRAAGDPGFSIGKFLLEGYHLCALPDVGKVLDKIHPKAAKEKAQTACFGLLFMAEFLRRVVRLRQERSLLAVNDINGIEVSWAAAIPMLYLPRLVRQSERSSKDKTTTTRDHSASSAFSTSAASTASGVQHSPQQTTPPAPRDEL